MSSSEETPLNQRIDDLENRAAYQDKLLEDLDEVVRVFANRVERLERRILELQDSVGTQEFGPGNDKPPHY